MLAAGPAGHAQQEDGQPDCGRAGRPWVSIAFVGAAWEPALRRAAFADLRAELGLSGFDACPLGQRGSEPPLAVIELHASAPEHVSVTIDVHDAVTEKRLARDLQLASVPADGRALTLAVAADELLRASWAELALSDAPEPARPAPLEVERTVERSLKPELRAKGPARGARLGARFAIEHHGAGQTLLGPDLVVGLWLSQRVALLLSLGARRGLEETSASGRLRSSALGGAVALEFAVLPADHSLELLGRAGLQAASMRFEGVAEDARLNRQGAAVDLHAFAGAALQLPLAGGLALVLNAGLGAPLISVQARDREREVSGTSSVQLRAAAGFEAAL